MLQAETDRYGERKTWATKYRIARESKLVYLDQIFSDLDIDAIDRALFIALLNPGATNEPKHIACSKLSAGLTARRRIYETPQQVKQRAPEIKALILEGYKELELLGYGAPKEPKA
jgi:hypothetical protein